VPVLNSIEGAGWLVMANMLNSRDSRIQIEAGWTSAIAQQVANLMIAGNFEAEGKVLGLSEGGSAVISTETSSLHAPPLPAG